MEDLAIGEFEAIITTRVYLDLLKNKGALLETCNRNEIALKYAIAANRVFEEKHFDNLKAIFRSKRAYIIYKPTGRIACEICIDGDYDSELIRRSKAILMNRTGFVKSKTLKSLTDYTANRGKTIYSNLSKGEINAKRKNH